MYELLEHNDTIVDLIAPTNCKAFKNSRYLTWV